MTGMPYELLDLLARWVHLIAGIMWIGNSLLFNWLDRTLRPAVGVPKTPAPVGTTWLLHSGGFYYVEKTLLEGAPLPRRDVIGACTSFTLPRPAAYARNRELAIPGRCRP